MLADGVLPLSPFRVKGNITRTLLVMLIFLYDEDGVDIYV